jgi:RNA-directed DNA polymerase
MQTKLDLISNAARRDESCRVTNLACMLNEENLTECFGMLKRDRASGIDNVSVEEYKEKLQENVANLVKRMKMQSYKPRPVRRTYIPKANGKLRPLGIPAVEDKVVQKGMSRILEAIYENDFLDCSYGFRPKRSCHQALKRLDSVITTMPINHIIDADIKGFFDNVDHEWMKKFLEVRVADKNFMRLIGRFLRNGYMESGEFHQSEMGTPQGGIISPILANIYLHYALDLWIERAVKPHCRGVVEMIRYADDFVICVQYKDEAEKILNALRERLKKFNLELAEDKTRHIEFGRFSKRNAQSKGSRPKTFNFLGFTHHIDQTRTGSFKLGRKTDRKKFSMKLKELNEWLKTMRHVLTDDKIWKVLRAKLSGHYQYFGLSGNYRGIKKYYYRTLGLVMKWLNRRSQKKSFNWDTFLKYLDWHPLPRPRICHNFYNLKTEFVNTNEEPCVGKLQARFCEGHSSSHVLNYRR